MRLQLGSSSSSSAPRSRSRSRSKSPLPFFRPRKPPPSPPLGTSSTDGPTPVLAYRTNSITSFVPGRAAQDGDRPQMQQGQQTSAGSVSDNTSILRLVKEDYVSARVYMKELDYRVTLRKALRRHMYSEFTSSSCFINVKNTYGMLALGYALITVRHFCRMVRDRHCRRHPHRPPYIEARVRRAVLRARDADDPRMACGLDDPYSFVDRGVFPAFSGA